MTFEYKGDKLRVNMPEQQGYMLLRDAHMYMVTSNNGQVMVVDMNSAFKMFGGMAASATPDMVTGEVLSIEPTGRKETVAGMNGEVYIIKYTDGDGTNQQAELVLSNDKRAVGFRDAIANMATTMGSAVEQAGFNKEMENGRNVQKELEKLDKGVLRYGTDMQVRSITATTVADERFVLPAEPTDLGAIMGGMTGGGSDSSGGGLGGFFGNKADRQQDRVEQKTDNAVDRATDNAVDRVLDKAFGKIFGN
ncbi:hypothetical protein [Haliea sp. E17]|uniref:hypothetical protein n=1 Tax=Haliea sp. E17 TaxID=3401576 RepID=UPI003AAB1E03